MPSPEAPSTTLFVRNLKPITTKDDLDSHFGGVGPLRRTLIVTDHSTGLCKGFGFVHFALSDDANTALSSLNGSILHGRRISLHFARPRQRGKADEDGGLAPRLPRPKDKPGKQVGKLKGTIPMRTVLLKRRDGSEMSEDEARTSFGEHRIPDSVFLVADGREARCTFTSWAEAGKAAAAAHGDKFDACIEAMKGGRSTRLIVRNLPFNVNLDEMRNAFSKYASLRELRLEPPRALKGNKGKVTAPANLDTSVNNMVSCAGFGFVEYFLVADTKFALSKLNGTKLGGRIIAVDLALGKSDYVKRIDEDHADEENTKKTGNSMRQAAGLAKNAYSSSTEESRSGSESEESDDTPKQSGNEVDENFGSDSVDLREQKTNPSKKPPTSSDTELARTVFVRNLLFETSASELWKAMAAEFGAVEQAVIVKDHVTGRPRGTAFVRFATESSADKAVKQGGDGDTSRAKSVLLGAHAGGFMLQGRTLLISHAVARSKAKTFAHDADQKVTQDDPRNIRLAWIGQIKPGTPEARGLSESDLARRTKSDREKKTKLSRNPNAFVSDVRLSVRNVPKDFEDRVLKQIFLLSARTGFGEKASVLRGSKSARDGSENNEARESRSGYTRLPRITYCKVIRDEERKDKSKGYGFVQFEKHEDALRALNHVNNNPKVIDMLVQNSPSHMKIDEHRERLIRKQWGNGRRLQVDFAVEDRRIVQVLEQVKEKGKALSRAHKKKKSEIAKQNEDNGGMNDIGGNGNAEKGTNSSKKENKLSRRERKTLKRKRVGPVEQEEEDRKQGRGRKNTGRSSNDIQVEPIIPHIEGVIPRRGNMQRKRGRENEVATVQPNPKAKKSKRKRTSLEKTKDEKLDVLVDAYKRKLVKGTTTSIGAVNVARNKESAMQRTRWFE